jgi:hypothetical protein
MSLFGSTLFLVAYSCPRCRQYAFQLACGIGGRSFAYQCRNCGFVLLEDPFSESPKIREIAKRKRPPQFRSVPMTLQVAAVRMGYCNREGARQNKASGRIKSGVARLSDTIKKDAISYEKLNRQTYVFDRRDFPKEVRTKIGTFSGGRVERGQFSPELFRWHFE